jgi:hypothetical protein
MGGVPPLGYDLRDRRLVVNEAEASIVKLIYQRYLELGWVIGRLTRLSVGRSFPPNWRNGRRAKFCRACSPTMSHRRQR